MAEPPSRASLGGLRKIWVEKVIGKILGRGPAAAGLWREKPARRRCLDADDHDRQHQGALRDHRRTPGGDPQDLSVFDRIG